MFIGSFFRQRPVAYREVTRTTSEIVGATCRVAVYVHFLEKWNYKDTVDVVNGKNIVFVKEEYQKDDWYQFIIEVHLSKKEYEIHRKNLKEYACNKAREQDDYKAILKDGIARCADGRDYEVEEDLPLNDPWAVEVQWSKREWKEYVPIER